MIINDSKYPFYPPINWDLWGRDLLFLSQNEKSINKFMRKKKAKLGIWMNCYSQMEEQCKELVSLCQDFRILCRLTKNARKKTKQGSALATPFSRRASDARRGLSFMKKGRRGHNAALGWLVVLGLPTFVLREFIILLCQSY